MDPLVSVPVNLDSAAASIASAPRFLEVGEYTASFTCDGATDTPEGEEVLVFTGTRNVTVNANQTTTIAFAP